MVKMMEVSVDGKQTEKQLNSKKEVANDGNSRTT